MLPLISLAWFLPECQVILSKLKMKKPPEGGAIWSETGGAIWSETGGAVCSEMSGSIYSEMSGAIWSEMSGAVWSEMGGAIWSEIVTVTKTSVVIYPDLSRKLAQPDPFGRFNKTSLGQG